MDGVLVDSEPLHHSALNEIIAPEGVQMSLEQYLPYMGTKAGWREFVADFGLAHTAEHYNALFQSAILRHYRGCTAAPGAIELVAALRKAGITLGLASSSVRAWVEACLGAIGLGDAFEAMVTGDEITEGKPHPATYLLAAERLGVDPNRCLAIEDSPAGIASATSAGLTCWAVRTPYSRNVPLPPTALVHENIAAIRAADIIEGRRSRHASVGAA